MSSKNTLKHVEVLSVQEVEQAIEKLALKIDEKFKGKDLLILSILKGAVYFFVHLTEKLTVEHSQYHIESSSYKDKQIQSEVKIKSEIVPEKFKGKKVIILDELFDNGQTMRNCVNAIIENTTVERKDIFTVTLMKKKKPDVDLPLDMFGILIPDVWVYGVGLDLAQKKRNLKNLMAIEKADPNLKNQDDELVFLKEGVHDYERWSHSENFSREKKCKNFRDIILSCCKDNEIKNFLKNVQNFPYSYSDFFFCIWGVNLSSFKNSFSSYTCEEGLIERLYNYINDFQKEIYISKSLLI